MTANINLHIERLVLDGVSLAPNQRHLLQASIEAELTRLLTNGGLAELDQGVAVPRLAGAHIQISQGNNAAQLGQQIAASVYSGLSPTVRNTGSSSTAGSNTGGNIL